jgi:hypothetical protein
LLLSEAKLTVRAEAHQIEVFVVRLAVNENEIGPDVAIAMIVPLAGQRMIDIAARQWRVGGKKVDDFHQQGIELLAEPAGFSRR